VEGHVAEREVQVDERRALAGALEAGGQLAGHDRGADAALGAHHRDHGAALGAGPLAFAAAAEPLDGGADLGALGRRGQELLRADLHGAQDESALVLGAADEQLRHRYLDALELVQHHVGRDAQIDEEDVGRLLLDGLDQVVDLAGDRHHGDLAQLGQPPAHLLCELDLLGEDHETQLSHDCSLPLPDCIERQLGVVFSAPVRGFPR
jgi:hypothetical protein